MPGSEKESLYGTVVGFPDDYRTIAFVQFGHPDEVRTADLKLNSTLHPLIAESNITDAGNLFPASLYGYTLGETELERKTRLYNILFPIFILVSVPSPLWLVLIPLNYVWDNFILSRSLKVLPEREQFCSRNSWKICMAGFISDIAGALFLFLEMLICGKYFPDFSDRIGYGLSMDPFYNIESFLSTLTAVFLSALLIYFIDRTILRKNGLEVDIASLAARNLSLLTAPWLFFIPSKWIYR